MATLIRFLTESDNLSLFILGALVLVLAFYLLIPLLIRAISPPFPFDPAMKHFTLEATGLAMDELKKVVGVNAELSASGFEFVDGVEMPQPASTLRSFVHLYRHPDREHEVILNFLVQTLPNTAARLQQMYVEYHLQRKDGSFVLVANKSPVGEAIVHPESIYVRRPDVQDVASLYQVFCDIVDKIPARDVKPLDRSLDASTRMKESFQKEFDFLVGAGLYRRDEAQQAYVMTIKGAYLMTFVSLWPGTILNTWRVQRRAQRMISALG